MIVEIIRNVLISPLPDFVSVIGLVLMRGCLTDDPPKNWLNVECTLYPTVCCGELLENQQARFPSFYSRFSYFSFFLFSEPQHNWERERNAVCVCVVREKRSVGVGNGARWLVGQPGPTSRQLALLSYTVRSHMRIEPLSRDYSIIFEAWVCFWKSNHPIKWGTILHEDRIMPLLDSSGHYRTFEKKT